MKSPDAMLSKLPETKIPDSLFILPVQPETISDGKHRRLQLAQHSCARMGAVERHKNVLIFTEETRMELVLAPQMW